MGHGFIIDYRLILACNLVIAYASGTAVIRTDLIRNAGKRHPAMNWILVDVLNQGEYFPLRHHRLIVAIQPLNEADRSACPVIRSEIQPNPARARQSAR